MKISIITVCFNARHCIEETIKSVVNQTYPNIEYIIIDGASTDGTLDIFEKYKHNIHKVISEKDSGIYDAMNKGVSNASGDILYFLNADDRIYDYNVLSKVAEKFKQDSTLEILSGKVEFVNVPENLFLDKGIEVSYNTKQHVLNHVPSHQGMFIRKYIFDKVGLFNTQYKICADFDWFLRAYNMKVCIKFVNDIMAFYDAQGASFKNRYNVISEKVNVVFKNSSIFEFAQYFIFASVRKLRDILFESSPSMPRIVQNVSWLFWDNAIRFLLGFFVIGWMARYLGPAHFGAFNYAVSIVSIFSLFAMLGLNELLVRFFVTHPSNKDSIITTAFILRSIAGSISFFMCLMLMAILKPSGDITLWLVGVIAFSLVFQAFDVIDLFFQSQLQSRHTVLAKITAFILMSITRIYLILSHASLLTFAWAVLVEVALGAVGLVVVYNALGYKLTGKYDHSIAKILLRSCWPICCAGFVAMASMRIGQILLFHLKGEHEAGIYASASRVIEIWTVIGYMLISTTFPVIVKLKNDNERIYRQKLKQFYKVIYAIGIGATFITFVFSKFIISTLFGADYLEAIPVLAMYCLSTTFIFMGGATTYVLVAENLQMYHLFRCVAGLIVNILLSLIFIPKWGAMGAVMATLMAYIINVYVIIIFKPARKIF